jgi:hypothetical protein
MPPGNTPITVNKYIIITHYMYINVYFMLVFDLTHDRGPTEGHTLHPDNDNISVRLKLSRPLRESHDLYI